MAYNINTRLFPRQNALGADQKLPSLADLRARYDGLQMGDCRPESLKIATDLHEWVQSQSVAVDRLDLLTAVNLVVESFDYVGQYTEARECLHEYGPRIKREIESLLEGGPSAADANRSAKRLLWRARISLLLNHAYTFYRQEEYESALRLILLASDGLDHLEAAGEGAFGTRWQLHYRMGQTYRQLNRFTDAEAQFTKAIACASRRLVNAASGTSDPQTESDAIAVSHCMVAKPLALGLGWLYWAEGRVNEAKPLLAAGQTLLHGTHDWVHLAYVRLLNACVKRAAAGKAPDVLAGVIQDIRDVYDVFTDTRTHPRHPYSIRAAYELAYTHHQLSQTDAAKKYINEVMTEAPSLGAGRWHALGLTLLSRIEKDSADPKDQERAVETAAKALRHAELLSQDRCRVEALIACGEAEFAASSRARVPSCKTASLTRAVGYLSRALDLTADNPKHRAACHLHLARIALAERNSSRAQEHLSVWERTFKARVECRWLHDYASVVRREHEALNVFSIDLSGGMKYDACKEQLQTFLLTRAEVEAGANAKKVAELLSVSRQTVYEWRGRVGKERVARKKSRRARKRAPSSRE